MTDRQIEKYWMDPDNRANIRRSISSAVVSGVIGAATGTVYFGNALLPLPVDEKTVPGKGVYDRTLFGGKYK
jgi:hypothetical protein